MNDNIIFENLNNFKDLANILPFDCIIDRDTFVIEDNDKTYFGINAYLVDLPTCNNVVYFGNSKPKEALKVKVFFTESKEVDFNDSYWLEEIFEKVLSLVDKIDMYNDNYINGFMYGNSGEIYKTLIFDDDNVKEEIEFFA